MIEKKKDKKEGERAAFPELSLYISSAPRWMVHE